MRPLRRSARPAPPCCYLKRDGTVDVATIRRLVNDGLLSWVKYAIARPDPSDDPCLPGPDRRRRPAAWSAAWASSPPSTTCETSRWPGSPRAAFAWPPGCRWTCCAPPGRRTSPPPRGSARGSRPWRPARRASARTRTPRRGSARGHRRDRADHAAAVRPRSPRRGRGRRGRENAPRVVNRPHAPPESPQKFVAGVEQSEPPDEPSPEGGETIVAQAPGLDRRAGQPRPPGKPRHPSTDPQARFARPPSHLSWEVRLYLRNVYPVSMAGEPASRFVVTSHQPVGRVRPTVAVTPLHAEPA